MTLYMIETVNLFYKNYSFKINKGSTLYITQRLSPTPATHSMANAILRVMHIFALFGLDGGSI